jgi:hypothetical protein
MIAKRHMLAHQQDFNWEDTGSLGGRWVSFGGYSSIDDGRVDAVIETIFTYVRGVHIQ